MDPTSLAGLDLSPIPGKQYTSFDREWREEFIYFLMVDRFHDAAARHPHRQTQRTPGVAAPDNAFYGGKIKGITQNLDYIAGLGCTAIWLSPVFENTPNAYHGYSIANYLKIDPNFGTKADLVELVDAAHKFQRNGKPHPIRVILDVVINHSGDNWEYAHGADPAFDGRRFDFGKWRRDDLPVPTELRNPDLYHRRGRIENWDTSPENQLGDLFGLKDFENDDDADGSDLINILIKAHSYWIRETDVDGFRVDAIKHMNPVACSRFSSGIREYAYSLGKRRFFLFGELATPTDEAIDRYIGPNTSVQSGGQTVFFGIDSVLDFRLAEGAGLAGILKGMSDPRPLFDRLDAQQHRALNRGELGRYLVTFVDNHDSFWQPGGRVAHQAPDDQVIAAIGYLICSLGTACIYYGTEQGFEGHGGDNQMREAMFDQGVRGRNLMNPDCRIYREIAKIADVMRGAEELRFGRMYYRPISGDGEHFGLPFGTDYTLAFSRMLYGSEVLVAYNVSANARQDRILIDSSLRKSGDHLTFLYGGTGQVPVEVSHGGIAFVHLDLKPHQFAILG